MPRLSIKKIAGQMLWCVGAVMLKDGKGKTRRTFLHCLGKAERFSPSQKREYKGRKT